jgi:UDP-galactopyranose mutase
MAKSRIGEQLYVKMIKDYTYKQWGKYPSELEKLVLARIPIRPNFDTRYFSDKYQALPKHGYTNFFKKLLNNPNITVRLNTDFFEVQEQLDLTDIPVIFTGPIDAYFKDKGLKMLEYRSIDFHLKRHFNCSFFQPNSVVNYPNKNVPYTRIVEYKHFLNQQSPHSIAVSETTNDYGDPYYPVPDKKNLDLYEKYRKLTHKEEVHFIGRLANYKYFNMDQSIDNAIRFFNEKISFIN